MSITNPNTVLILGAGVSAPFGIPLGGELIDQIASAIGVERRSLESANDPFGTQLENACRYGAYQPDGFFAFPIHGAIARKYSNLDQQKFDKARFSEDRDRLYRLGTLLSNQCSETIDDFIVENPSYAELAKIAIAALLLKKCYYQPNAHAAKPWAPHVFDGRTFGQNDERNWIHLLINVIRQGIRKGEVTKDNKIKIVTFNYDRILEYVLSRQFSNTEAGHGNYADFIDIYHVHGRFEDVATENLDFAAMTLRWASGVHVVNEQTVPKEVVEARKVARELISDAIEIYCVGFAFSGPNCRLLGLDNLQLRQPNLRRYLYYCNYDGNVGVKRSAERVNRPLKRIVVEEAAGTRERPLSVSDWLKAGHLGELPG